jgi:broad specificity phosphatase PhoE
MRCVRVRFMRHSESCSNVLSEDTHIRYRNPELTTRGHLMAAERAASVRMPVYSTPLLRARQTARHFGDASVIPYMSLQDTLRTICTLGKQRILFVHHKGFLQRLTKWITGTAIEFANLDAVEIEVCIDGGRVGVRLLSVDRYRPSAAIPANACDIETGCRINVCGPP